MVKVGDRVIVFMPGMYHGRTGTVELEGGFSWFGVRLDDPRGLPIPKTPGLWYFKTQTLYPLLKPVNRLVRLTLKK